jgi:flavin-binding protein dodecin
MAIMKSEQILSESPTSFEDAIQVAVNRFSKTVRNLRSAYVNDMSAVIEDGRIKAYRVNIQMTFEVEDVGVAYAAEQHDGEKPKKKKKK